MIFIYSSQTIAFKILHKIHSADWRVYLWYFAENYLWNWCKCGSYNILHFWDIYFHGFKVFRIQNGKSNISFFPFMKACNLANTSTSSLVYIPDRWKIWFGFLWQLCFFFQIELNLSPDEDPNAWIPVDVSFIKEFWLPDAEILNLKVPAIFYLAILLSNICTLRWCDDTFKSQEFKTLDVLSKLEGLWLNRNQEIMYAGEIRL